MVSSLPNWNTCVAWSCLVRNTTHLGNMCADASRRGSEVLHSKKQLQRIDCEFLDIDPSPAFWPKEICGKGGKARHFSGRNRNISQSTSDMTEKFVPAARRKHGQIASVVDWQADRL